VEILLPLVLLLLSLDVLHLLGFGGLATQFVVVLLLEEPVSLLHWEFCLTGPVAKRQVVEQALGALVLHATVVARVVGQIGVIEGSLMVGHRRREQLSGLDGLKRWQ